MKVKRAKIWNKYAIRIQFEFEKITTIVFARIDEKIFVFARHNHTTVHDEKAVRDAFKRERERQQAVLNTTTTYNAVDRISDLLLLFLSRVYYSIV